MPAGQANLRHGSGVSLTDVHVAEAEVLDFLELLLQITVVAFGRKFLCELLVDGEEFLPSRLIAIEGHARFLLLIDCQAMPSF